jgi:hypothetical protein
MYLIQQTTKQPTEEILGFFYDLGIKVAEIGFNNMEGRSIRKDIRDIYPDTNIPFRLLVKGYGDRTYDSTTRKYVRTGKFHGTMEISFPDKAEYVDQQALVEKIFEKTLLGAESLPNFPKPASRTPKMYKDLINEVLKKK